MKVGILSMQKVKNHGSFLQAYALCNVIKNETGAEVEFVFDNGTASVADFKLVVQCGSCMLTRREVMRRIDEARKAGVPVVNYGMILAKAAGLDLGRIVF